ncbi:DNA-3-methyladenine glycosylase [Streptacidiphilus cavernicola]|uniref:Putative 3-methyladenine DNA glycosylase n=1 Tax=Streptacidiphilus cavernicola TaxID=3342716 RepID=A0ABV6W0Z9_9ACTN
MSELGGLLPRDFYARAAHEVAPELLGRLLLREEEGPDGPLLLRITEVEAYEGAIDPASHGFRGPTARNATMFGPPGHLYVYWIYGMHHAANLVCGDVDESHGVLIRAGEVVQGRPRAIHRRPNAKQHTELARGPGRLTLALDIDRSLDGTDVCDPGAAVRVYRGTPLPASAVRSGPRTGVSKAHETPWRFWAADDRTVSPYRRHVPKKRAAQA